MANHAEFSAFARFAARSHRNEEIGGLVEAFLGKTSQILEGLCSVFEGLCGAIEGLCKNGK
ncbi:MAG: hypothetical protein WA700_15100 [Acidobacteriaceae bacterium]